MSFKNKHKTVRFYTVSVHTPFRDTPFVARRGSKRSCTPMVPNFHSLQSTSLLEKNFYRVHLVTIFSAIGRQNRNQIVFNTNLKHEDIVVKGNYFTSNTVFKINFISLLAKKKNCKIFRVQIIYI